MRRFRSPLPVDLRFEMTLRDHQVPFLSRDIKENPIPETEKNQILLQIVKYTTRGFARRNWTHLESVLTRAGANIEFINTIKISWSKFKMFRSLDRRNKNNHVFIWKHFIDFKGQKSYESLFELSRDKTYDTLVEELQLDELDTPETLRLLDYFYNSDKDMILPPPTFPLLFPETESKMKYCDYRLKKINEKKVLEMITSYIVRLGIEKIFVPPPDILYKVGYQKYNDGGDVKYDIELPTKIDSGFKYQKFLAQPMKPREVWLPGKAIKNNNIFDEYLYADS